MDCGVDMKFFLNKRQVYINDLLGKIGEYAAATDANYSDGNGEDLTNDELDELSDLYSRELYEAFYALKQEPMYDTLKEMEE